MLIICTHRILACTRRITSSCGCGELSAAPHHSESVNLPVWSVVNPPAAGDSNNCISELWATCWNSLSMFLHFTLEFHIKMSFGSPPVVLIPLDSILSAFCG